MCDNMYIAIACECLWKSKQQEIWPQPLISVTASQPLVRGRHIMPELTILIIVCVLSSSRQHALSRQSENFQTQCCSAILSCFVQWQEVAVALHFLQCWRGLTDCLQHSGYSSPSSLESCAQILQHFKYWHSQRQTQQRVILGKQSYSPAACDFDSVETSPCPFSSGVSSTASYCDNAIGLGLEGLLEG